MKPVLIDTQALIWLAEGSPDLSRRGLLAIDSSSSRLTSLASVWEMAIKIQIGKLELKAGTLRGFVTLMRENGIELLSVTPDDAIRVASLPQVKHRDPFDRLIAAQCLRRNLTLVSVDAAFDDYGVQRVW